MRRVLQHLKQYGIKLKLSKCEVFRKYITWKIVSVKGSKMDPNDTKAVRALKEKRPWWDSWGQYLACWFIIGRTSTISPRSLGCSMTPWKEKWRERGKDKMEPQVYKKQKDSVRNQFYGQNSISRDWRDYWTAWQNLLSLDFLISDSCLYSVWMLQNQGLYQRQDGELSQLTDPVHWQPLNKTIIFTQGISNFYPWSGPS